MDCTRFEGTLDLLSSGTAPAAIRAAAELHLRTCGRCRRLYGAHGAGDGAAPRAPDLTGPILEKTTGPACPAAERALWDRYDDGTDAGTHLLEAHCLTCADCRNLAATMHMLRRVLPQMAALDPGEEFTAAVVAATHRLPGRRPRSPRSPGELWHRLVRRPLFAWEAAYAGTVLFALLFLNPLLPVGTLSLRVLAGAHRIAATRVVPAETALIGFARNVTDGVAGCGFSVGATLGAWTGRADAFLHGTVRELRTRMHGAKTPHRTFLRPMRLPGCEVRITDADNRGDHV